MSKSQNKTETKKYNLNIIWSFAEKEQFMTDVQVLPDNCRDISEVCFIKNIILNEFTDDLHLTEEVRKTLEAFDAHFRDALKMHAPKAAYHPLVKEPDDPTFPCSLKLKVNACGSNACRFWQDDQTPLGDIRTVKTAGAKIVPIINFSKAWFMGTQCGITAELRAAVISQSTGTTATDVFPL